MKVSFFMLTLFPLILFSQIQDKTEIDRFLTNWHNAAAKVELTKYFDALAEDAVFIGTDSIEHWTKKEFYDFAKPYFDKGKAWSFKANSRNIFISKDKMYAWFDELLYTGSTTWRGSGVIVKEQGELKIKHYTLSVTLPNDKMKDFFELLKN